MNEQIPSDETIFHPVYVTPEEKVTYNSINSKTKETITKYVEDILEKIQCDDAKEYFHNLLLEARDKKLLIQLYQDLSKDAKQQCV